jgi:DNA-binding transcriptional ArsR family regulator
MDSQDRLQRRLACLGDPSRFRILATLLQSRPCVSELAQTVRLSQSCTTRHLQALTAAGVVRPEREGKRVVYVIRVDDPDIAQLVGWLAGRPGTRAQEVESASAGNPALTGPHSSGEVASQEEDVTATRRGRPGDIEEYLL